MHFIHAGPSKVRWEYIAALLGASKECAKVLVDVCE